MCCDNEKLVRLKKNLEQRRKNHLSFADGASNDKAKHLFNMVAEEDGEVIRMINMILGSE